MRSAVAGIMGDRDENRGSPVNRTQEVNLFSEARFPLPPTPTSRDEDF